MYRTSPIKCVISLQLFLSWSLLGMKRGYYNLLFRYEIFNFFIKLNDLVLFFKRHEQTNSSNHQNESASFTTNKWPISLRRVTNRTNFLMHHERTNKLTFFAKRTKYTNFSSPNRANKLVNERTNDEYV